MCSPDFWNNLVKDYQWRGSNVLLGLCYVFCLIIFLLIYASYVKRNVSSHSLSSGIVYISVWGKFAWNWIKLFWCQPNWWRKKYWRMLGGFLRTLFKKLPLWLLGQVQTTKRVLLQPISLTASLKYCLQASHSITFGIWLYIVPI